MKPISILCLCLASSSVYAETPRVFPAGQLPNDKRLGELQTLNGYFPFQRVDSVAQWQTRQQEIHRRILVSQGLWPMPTKSPLNAVIHGRVERDDYFVDRVHFESIPGHFVTGSLYRPRGKAGKFPAVLSPHGHWSQGRFYDAGEGQIKNDIKNGAEQFEIGGRYPIQARAVQLARMGVVVFVYDMTGEADSIQIAHRPQKWSHLDRDQDWGFMSTQAELRLQNMMGLQTWNSIRVIDFLSQLEDVDSSRIGVTGASGGGTQSMIIAAIDDRITAAMPCVMVSTAMQGGCTCENAPLLRIDQGNIDIAAAVAPRPLGLTAADDWTIELETKGYPDLVKLYEMLGHRDRLTAVFHTRFKHNYNQVNRAAMYEFFNRHFELGLDQPIGESDFRPLSKEEATVWNEDHPQPRGDSVGDAHEVQILRIAAKDSDMRIGQLTPQSASDLAEFRRVIGGAWETILGRRLDQVGDVTFVETSRGRAGKMVQTLGHVDHAADGEQFPAIRIGPAEANQRATVVWITDTGKSELFRDGKLIEPIQRLVDSGHTVWSADLFGQGEFLPDGKPITAQRMWYQRNGDVGWHRFSGYTYGYNHPLLVQRVHDILSLIRLARMEAETVHLVGLGKIAGPLVAAARSQADDAIAETLIDTAGFEFKSLRKQDDPMFVPGAVKYLGVDGLLALAAPAKITILSDGENSPDRHKVVKAAYDAAGASESITWTSDRERLLQTLPD